MYDPSFYVRMSVGIVHIHVVNEMRMDANGL